MTSPDILNREQEEEGWDKLSQHCPGLLSTHLSLLFSSHEPTGMRINARRE